jgi:hypothetical protein
VFLQHLSQGWTVTAAAHVAGIHRHTAYDFRAIDADFAKAWDDAYEEGTDVLEQEAFRRAAEGVEKPVFQGGVLVGTVREYSDHLMLALLKARRPQHFRERVSVDQRIEVMPPGERLSRARAAGETPELEAAIERVAEAFADQATKAEEAKKE